MLSVETIDKILDEFDMFSYQYIRFPYWQNIRALNLYRENGYRFLLWLQHHNKTESDIRVKKIYDMLNECGKIQLVITSTHFRGE